jgi:hypothetical protein
MKRESERNTMDTSKLKWIGDSGHAWLVVPMKLAKQVEGISAFSYRSPSGSVAYLECDCDATLFIKHYDIDGAPIATGKLYNGDAPIRRYPSYQ